MGSYTNFKTVNTLIKKGPLICVNQTDSVELFDLIEGNFKQLNNVCNYLQANAKNCQMLLEHWLK